MGTTASIALRPIRWRAWMKTGVAFLQEQFPRKRATELVVEKSVALGQKANAVLLTVNGEKILLGVTANSVSVLRGWAKLGEAMEIRGRVR
jgi:hypothetical protein